MISCYFPFYKLRHQHCKELIFLWLSCSCANQISLPIATVPSVYRLVSSGKARIDRLFKSFSLPLHNTRFMCHGAELFPLVVSQVTTEARREAEALGKNHRKRAADRQRNEVSSKS